MNWILYLFGLPILIYVIARMIDTHYKVGGNRLILVTACLLFGISVIIPSPPIHGQDTQFLTHLLGGGVFVGLLWLYFKRALGKMPWYMELLYLYIATSALGVANELYELFAYEVIGFDDVPLTDTSWDLVANTLGMLLFYGVYRLMRRAKSLFFSR